MGTLRAATDELHATASGWHTLAGELTGTAPSGSGLSFQPTAAAVTAIHVGITAAKTAAAAIAYTENEATSAAMLNALSEAL
jgi:hypothetical protein